MKLHLVRGEVDLVTGRGTVAERPVHLTKAQCALLGILVAHPGEVVHRDRIMVALGVRVGAKGRIVDLAIRRLRAKVEVDPKDPAHIISVYNEGYRFHPVVADPVARLGLPPERTPLVGRSSALSRVQRALLRNRLVTVTGVAGTGKSALALRVAHTAPGQRVVFVSLTSVRSVYDLLLVLAPTLEVPTADLTTGRLATARILGALRDGPGTLLVLDDCEGAVSVVASFVGGVAQHAPQTVVLVTSRVLVGLPTEYVVRLGPLDPEHAVALFLAQAHGVDAPIRDDDPVLIELVQRLDCLPLSLELAAARARALSPAAMLARLHERFRLLSGLRPTLLWSWELLGAPAREALARLSVFLLPVSAEAVATVLGPAADSLVDELVTSSWIYRRGSQLVMLESIRELGLEQATRLGVRADAEDAHARYHADLARRLRGNGPIDLQALDALDAVLPELLTVGRVAARDPASAITVVRALHDRFHLRGPVRPMIDLVDATLAGQGDALPHERPLLHMLKAAALRSLGQLDEALAEVDEAAATASEDLIGSVEAERARSLHDLGRRAEARDAFETALRLPMDPQNRAIVQAELAVALQFLGEPVRAEQLLRAAIDEAIAVGEVRVGSFRSNLGALLQGQGRLREAEAELFRALHTLEAQGNERRCATVRYNLATLAAERGDFAEAVALCDQAEGAWVRHGASRLLVYAALLRAEMQLAQGLPIQALMDLDIAVDRIEGVGGGNPERIQEGGDRVVALVMAGRVEEARAMLDAVAALGASEARLAVLGAHISGDRSQLPDLDEAADGPVRFLVSLFR